MIEMLSRWVQSIVSLLLFLAFVQLLLPDHRLRDYTRLVLGLVVIGVILTPLLGMFDPYTWDAGLKEALSATGGRSFPALGGASPRGRADPSPWIARGISLARDSGEGMGERVRTVWARQVRSLASLVAGVEAVEVDARWRSGGDVDELRLKVWPSEGAVQAVAGAEDAAFGRPDRDALALRVKAAVSDYFHIPPERVHVEVEGWAMAP